MLTEMLILPLLMLVQSTTPDAIAPGQCLHCYLGVVRMTVVKPCQGSYGGQTRVWPLQKLGWALAHGNGSVLFLHIGARYADAIRGSREPDIAVPAPVHVS